MFESSYCLFLSPKLWTFTVSNDLRACSSALFVMAERTPVVKKYRDALETVIGATMEFLARASSPNPNQDQSLTSDPQTQNSPTKTDPKVQREVSSGVIDFPPGFTGVAQESHIRGSPRVADIPMNPDSGEGNQFSSGFEMGDTDVFDYMAELERRPAPPGRLEGRHGEMGQMDAEWLLSLCQGDGFSLSMLNEMMNFEPSLGA